MSKIKNKLVFSFGTTIGVLLLVMILNSGYSKKSVLTHKQLESKIEPAINILNNYHSYNEELFLLALNKITTNQSALITNRMKIITEVELPNLDIEALSIVSTLSLDDTKVASFKNIISLSKDYNVSVKRLYAILHTKKDYSNLEKQRKATNILNSQLSTKSNELEYAIAALQLDLNEESRSLRSELRNQLNNLLRIILITSVIAIIISIFVAFKTIQSIVKPIKILKVGAKRISQGDYKYRVCLEGKDELTLLGNSFNEMAGSLNNSFENIQRKNKELEQFVYIASHDLQEPLRTLDSFTSLLSKQFKGNLDETGDEYIRFISQATRRMQCLVKDLMDYSRLGSDKILESIDCEKLVLGVKDDLSKLIDEKEGELVIGELPKVQGYKTSLRLLFQNLINNAIKFQKPNAHPLVEIFHEDTKNFWKFGVKDNGIGIEDQHQEKIFSIFKRLHSRNKFEGTGIGLAHCQKIVEMHEGTIEVSSELNKGSTFYFTIAKGLVD